MDNYDKNITRYDELFKGFLVIAALVTLVGLGIGVRQILIISDKIDKNVQQTQKIIEANQQSTLEARQANIKRQEEDTNYTKCLVLYPKKNPQFNYETASAEETEAVLDSCAKVE